MKVVLWNSFPQYALRLTFSFSAIEKCNAEWKEKKEKKMETGESDIEEEEENIYAIQKDVSYLNEDIL